MCLGIPGQIIEISNPEHKLAIVKVGGVKRQVNIACIVDEEHPPEKMSGRLGVSSCGFCYEQN